MCVLGDEPKYSYIVDSDWRNGFSLFPTVHTNVTNEAASPCGRVAFEVVIGLHTGETQVLLIGAIHVLTLMLTRKHSYHSLSKVTVSLLKTMSVFCVEVLLAFFDLRLPRLPLLAPLWPLMHGQGSTRPQALPSTPHARRVGRKTAAHSAQNIGTPRAFLDLEGHHELVVMCPPRSSRCFRKRHFGRDYPCQEDQNRN